MASVNFKQTELSEDLTPVFGGNVDGGGFNQTNIGNMAIGGTLGVTGATTLSSTATIATSLGVGTLTPISVLQVKGASNQFKIQGNATDWTTLGFINHNTADNSYHWAITEENGTGDMHFKYGNSITVGGLTTALKIDYTNGNIMIGGTADNGYKLEVTGTTNITGNTTVGGTLGVTGAVTLQSTLGVDNNITITSGGILAFNDTDVQVHRSENDLMFIDATTGGGSFPLSELINPYDFAEISTENNAGSLAVGTTYVQIDNFDTNGISNSSTPDHTNDHITIGDSGVYRIGFSSSFSGTLSTTFDIEIKKNNGATGFPNLHITRKLGTGGDVGDTTCSGLIALTEGDTLEVWIKADGASKAFVAHDLNLNINCIKKSWVAV